MIPSGFEKIRERHPQISAKVKELERIQGHHYKNFYIPALALIHRSCRYGPEISNERLEFLGDCYLNLIITESCMSQYPTWEEGQLSRLRAQIVGTKSLTQVGCDIGLNHLVVSAKGALPDNSKAIADVFEATIAALWIDGGRDKAYQWVRKLFDSQIHQPLLSLEDPKSAFQQWVQSFAFIPPHYEVIEIKEDHHLYFIAKVFLGDKYIAKGKGVNKKEATLAAAQAALELKSQGKISSEDFDIEIHHKD